MKIANRATVQNVFGGEVIDLGDGGTILDTETKEGLCVSEGTQDMDTYLESAHTEHKTQVTFSARGPGYSKYLCSK